MERQKKVTIRYQIGKIDSDGAGVGKKYFHVVNGSVYTHFEKPM